ncbi:Pex2 / Pex12 amino terminal region [Nesidiocoris tenuis]|uniref:RING-type E3 ubiquitin transferase (cysteine targeting) n=1 Tax=Nesidiocoris tenuis TaxID=355587 RepID=A0ABN7B5F1_9HEMI|nr:Pex2 / Pex12 amino terminal region [Nesidiocoris tenuis]
MAENVGGKKPYIASRVSVFDSQTLDKEIYGFLKKQIQHIASDSPWNGISSFEPELDAFLKILLWMLSVEKSRSTFGQQLLCLKYENGVPLHRLRLLGGLNIGLAYLKARSQNLKTVESKLPVWVSFVLKHAEFFLTSLNFLFFLAFLRRGGSPHFTDNLLGIKPVSTVKPSERSIGYSYMTRELLWHGAIELFCLVLPHVNVLKLGRIARNAVFGKKDPLPVTKTPIFTSQTTCSICKLRPIVPHTIGCEHFFCHFCISSCLLADQKFECPDCCYSNHDGCATRYFAERS